jgi:hypothetical protein
MEIHLVLTERRGRLVYSLPLWYRVLMAAIALLVGGAFAASGEAPAPLGWIVLAIVVFAALYEDRWTFDPAAGSIEHRAGLVFAARRSQIELDKIERFRIAPYVRGTIPGSEDERKENEVALAGNRKDDGRPRRSFSKKHYLRLICEGRDGAAWLVDTVDARKLDSIHAAAAKIAAACGKPLIEA